MRPAAPSCPAAAWTEPNPSGLQAARWTRKLGAALRFLMSATKVTDWPMATVKLLYFPVWILCKLRVVKYCRA
ncbi:protein of unknown function [Thiomonas sp. Bio17B3]|nr:protein of unknown function [Thiomonas sp. Bio17B3]VDY13065.1 protein of unknown function [Thiomonas sp. OC7]VDY17731.1 protein of unknown function [Thiomonas sp. CB2]